MSRVRLLRVCGSTLVLYGLARGLGWEGVLAWLGFTIVEVLSPYPD